MKKIAIIGCGKIGRAFGKMFYHSGYEISTVYNRTGERAQESVKIIGAGKPITDLKNVGKADIYFFSGKDESIEISAREVADYCEIDNSNSIAWHVSGALSSLVLDERFKYRASIHPIKSFASEFENSSTILRNIFCGYEGDKFALSELLPFFYHAGANLVEVDRENKIFYYSAAVFVANFLPILIETSLACYAKAGISAEVALQMLEPLLDSTMKNIHLFGVEKAITGPARRGDLMTVEKISANLEKTLPEYTKMYKELTQMILNKSVF